MLQLYLLSESKVVIFLGYSGNAAYVLSKLFKNVNHYIFY